MTNDSLPLLWLSGPTGVGKSTVGWEVFAQLSRTGVKTAFVDADQISLCYPMPEDLTHRLRARNLAAMWPHFRKEGVQCLVPAGFVDTPEEVREYTALLPGAAFTVCRLRVDGAELKERFLTRGWRPHLVQEAVIEAEALERSDYADACVDTGGLGVSEAARLVCERVGGWPGTLPAATFHSVVDQQNHPTSQADAAPASAPVPVLWLSGATAVGKSTVGYEIFTQVYRTGVRAAYVDVQQIGALRPAADDDVVGHRLKARNLAAIWAGHRAAGALHRIAERAAHEAKTLDSAAAGDLRVDTDGRSVREIAANVRARGGNWPNLFP